jgi:integrase
MASIVPLRNGSWQVVFKDKFFQTLTGEPKGYVTFKADERDKAEAFRVMAEGKLKLGIVPDELKPENKKARGGDRVSAAVKNEPAGQSTRLLEIVNQYCASRRVSESDNDIYSLLVAETGNPMFSEMTLQWAEKLVARYKEPKMMLAPSTIRKRIGALTRAVDWYQQKVEIERPISFGKSLGRGYSHYANGEKKDIQRERLFRTGEEAKVLGLFDGTTEITPAKKLYMADILNDVFKRLYLTIRHTGMRLRECYWLRVEQIDFKTGLIQIDGTKGHYGEIKKRHVPMKPIVRETLKAAIEGKQPTDLVFPFWDGKRETLDAASAYLSQAFTRIFETAGVAGMREHDLRHVATVDWVSMKSAKTGNWLFQESELLQMMGWTNRAMLDRYIKGYRADDLASRMDEMAA